MKFQELYKRIESIVESHRSEVNTYYHVTPYENLKSIFKNGLVPSIGDRSAKLEEANGIYLFEDADSADDAVANWLGDEFDDETQLSLLKVTIPRDIVLSLDIVWDGFSFVARNVIPPQYITIESELI